MKNTLGIILGGGQGKRLFPLTKYRSKPAVPLGGKYRLIDIPISNCINSGIQKIFVLTQFNSASLNQHINLTYKFDSFRHGFVDILAAEQTVENTDWYQGTADAVRKNMRHFHRYDPPQYLILSGDHIYRMDYTDLIKHHIKKNADITISVTPIQKSRISQFGILKMNKESRIIDFKEKPKDDFIIDQMKCPQNVLKEFGVVEEDKRHIGSMGIYVFSDRVLEEVLADKKLTDFGSQVIPSSLNKFRVFGYIFKDYWEDIGTIESFYKANINLTKTEPMFNLYDSEHPIYTHARFLPGSKISRVHMNQSIINEGCLINRSTINRSIIGVRSRINEGSLIEDTFLMGADYAQSLDDLAEDIKLGIPNIGIGKNSRISKAIIDKNARVGSNVKIGPHPDDFTFSGPGYMVKNGITVVEKDAVIPDGMEI